MNLGNRTLIKLSETSQNNVMIYFKSLVISQGKKIHKWLWMWDVIICYLRAHSWYKLSWQQALNGWKFILITFVVLSSKISERNVFTCITLSLVVIKWVFPNICAGHLRIVQYYFTYSLYWPSNNVRIVSHHLFRR